MTSEEAVKILRDMRDELKRIMDDTNVDELQAIALSLQEQALNHGINALVVLNCLGEDDGTSD